jgi:hypothetical protein
MATVAERLLFKRKGERRDAVVYFMSWDKGRQDKTVKGRAGHSSL